MRQLAGSCDNYVVLRLVCDNETNVCALFTADKGEIRLNEVCEESIGKQVKCGFKRVR